MQIPHGVQQSMSSESHPSLGGVVPHLELFMTAWENKVKATPRLKPFIDIGLKWAEKYYKRMDDTRAYVIAMCKFTLFTRESQLILYSAQLLTHQYE